MTQTKRQILGLRHSLGHCLAQLGDGEFIKITVLPTYNTGDIGGIGGCGNHNVATI